MHSRFCADGRYPEVICVVPETSRLSTLVNFDGGIACPEKWGTFEPLKTPFEADDIGILVRILAEPQANFSRTGESQVGQNNPLILLFFV